MQNLVIDEDAGYGERDGKAMRSKEKKKGKRKKREGKKKHNNNNNKIIKVEIQKSRAEPKSQKARY